MESDAVANYLNQVVRLNADWNTLRKEKQLNSKHRAGVDTPIYSD